MTSYHKVDFIGLQIPCDKNLKLGSCLPNMEPKNIAEQIQKGFFTIIALDSDNTIYDIINAREIYEKVLENIDLCITKSKGKLYDKIREITRKNGLSYFYITKQFWFTLVSLLNNIICENKRSESDVINAIIEGNKLYIEFVNRLLNSLKITLIGANIRLLKSFAKIAVISEEEKSLLSKKLKTVGVLEDIDFIVSSSDTGVTKPHSSYFELLLNHFKVEKNRILYVDDKLENVDFARKIGVQALTREDFEKVIRIILEKKEPKKD